MAARLRGLGVCVGTTRRTHGRDNGVGVGHTDNRTPSVILPETAQPLSAVCHDRAEAYLTVRSRMPALPTRKVEKKKVS